MKCLAVIALFRDGQVLLGKRSASRNYYPGVWDFPGGHCLEGEPFQEAMLREAAEEMGILPMQYQVAADVQRAGQFHAVLFVVTAWEGTVRNEATEEHEALAWFTLDEARLLPLPDTEYQDLFDLLDGHRSRLR